MTRIERTIGTVLRVGVLVSTVALAAGLVLELLDAPGAQQLLTLGILTLLATPTRNRARNVPSWLRTS